MEECICGTLYVPGDPDDDKAHANCKKTYLSGPEISEIDQLSPIKKIDIFSIYVIDKTCPEQIRYEFNLVAKVAKQSMSKKFPTGYDHTFTNSDQNLFIATVKTQVVAMVLTCTTEDVESIFNLYCTWGESEESFKVEEQVPKTDKRYRVARVWTAEKFRCKGIAPKLLETASERLSCRIVDFAWDLPLTKDGEKLLKRLCPDFFWGCGNYYTISELI